MLPVCKTNVLPAAKHLRNYNMCKLLFIPSIQYIRLNNIKVDLIGCRQQIITRNEIGDNKSAASKVNRQCSLRGEKEEFTQSQVFHRNGIYLDWVKHATGYTDGGARRRQEIRQR